MVAMSVVGIAVLVQTQQVTIALREQHVEVETQFAFQKATSILAELQASVDQGTVKTAQELELAEDESPNPFLTTRDVETADHVMSGNVQIADGNWKWYRDIDVEPLEGVDRSRYVRVTIKRVNEHGNVFTAAVASGILNVVVRSEPVVKEYDVYMLALNEAPSLWQTMPALRAQMQGLASEIAGANPNLRFRLHWITKLGYGRDATYVPYVNQYIDSATSSSWAYWYPGKLAAGAGASTLYAAELFEGRVRTEGGMLNDFDSDANPLPHAVADRFNHCMRTPEARALFEQRVAAGLEDEQEPPLQLLLADMHTQPERFRNALFVNLHGDAIPFPPLRNYSDAAKDPVNHPGARVVTHPTRLHTPRGGGGLLAQVASFRAQLQAAQSGTNEDARDELGQALAKLDDTEKEILNGDPVGARGKLTDCGGEIKTALDEGLNNAVGMALLESCKTLDASLDGGSVAGADGPEFRVYAYKTDPAQGPAVLSEPITVEILGVDLTANVNGSSNPSLELRRAMGGINLSDGTTSGTTFDYEMFDDPEGLPPLLAGATAPYDMTYEIGYATTPEPHTWIRLHNTPLTTPQRGDSGSSSVEGLRTDARLYGLEYVPGPLGSMDDDYAAGHSSNTARWRIRIPAAMLPNTDTRITVRTRIGTDVMTGTMWPVANEPTNLSTTYTWWTDDAEDVPLTERYQFQGDPRHNPYEDLLAGGASFPNGYNWWFDDMRHGTIDASPAWPGIDGARLRDGFGEGGVAFDVPRMMQVWRDALQSSGAVFINPGGALADAVVLGGEIALPDAGVPMNGSLFGATGVVTVDDITAALDSGVAAAPTGGYVTVMSGGGDTDPTPSGMLGRMTVLDSATGFFAMEWLGELVPDAQWSTYVTNGNLATSATGLRRRPLTSHANLPAGTYWGRTFTSWLGEHGGSSLVQSGSDLATFAHCPAPLDQVARLSDDAYALTQAVGVATPREVSATAPFSLNAELSSPLPHRAYSEFPNQSVSLLEEFADAPAGHHGTGVLRVSALDGRAAFFVPFGDTPQTPDEHRAVGYKAFALGLRALHVAGEPAHGLAAVDQVPIVEIATPVAEEVLENPSSVAMTWKTEHLRFDLEDFTPGYTSSTGSEMESGYVLTYRAEGEEVWHHVSDGTEAEAGVWPSAPGYMIPDSGTGNETFTISLPNVLFPAGRYVLRIDRFHQQGHMHVSHHEVIVTIQR